MKRKQMFFLRLFLIGLSARSAFSLQAQQSQSLDPMIDFRAPCSLTEVLHEGLISIDGLLQECVGGPDERGSLLSSVSSELHRLHGAYDEMINRSKMHTVYRDDREFLQKMIDRIDSLINALEGSSDLSDHDAEVLRENSSLVRQLQDKI